jgi:hypothetical protein
MVKASLRTVGLSRLGINRCLLTVDVKGEDGKVVQWVVETSGTK